VASKRKSERTQASPAVAAAAGTSAASTRGGRTRAFAIAALLAAAMLGALAWQIGRGPDSALESSKGSPAAPIVPAVAADFVGSDSCKACHTQEYAAWTSSQHARAMQHATADTVRGDFNDAKFTFDRVTSSFFRRDGKYFVRTDGPDGRLADFEVKYTFGLEPLQQYLVELPGGRLQALAVSWDARPKEQGGQRWFRQYPDEKLDFRDELHWTQRSQNWNFMCADCHSTAVTKGYNAHSNSFDTRYKEVAVGCETCHGPGSAHIAWSKDKPADHRKGLTLLLDERRGVTWSIDAASGTAKRSRTRASDREIEVCAQCHARRAQIAEGYRAGQPFLDHYLPSLLVAPLYWPDGQQREEVFVWGSWLQSRMHRQGVTCSDCHDPHTQKLRVEGNAVCGQCHAPGKYDAPSHHHHQAGSAGAQCVACHMPQTTYMVVDPRRDHSMRVPRPDQSVALGVPNACSGCHTRLDAKQDAPWAAAAVRRWLGRDAQGFQSFAPTFAAADAQRLGAAGSLLAVAEDLGQPPIVRASALERLATTGRVDPATVQRAARDAQPLVRLAAVRLAESLPPAETARLLAPLLADPLRAIRIEAARALAGEQPALGAAERAAWQKAADEYLATLAYTADRPEARVALGSFQARLGRFDEAQAAFAQARALDPGFLPAYLNAADALRQQGREPESQRMLEQGLAQAPKSAPLHHALGLALVRQGDTARALKELDQAARLAPDDARYTYVYAVALNSAGRPAEAITVLERATARWPGDRDLRLALITMQRDAGRGEAARASAARAAQAFPEDPDLQALARQLK
jgi:tetratricopeptide (TPR) repeat protein/Zn finger protein HypA/HybF involved in hydrogenase expression